MNKANKGLKSTVSIIIPNYNGINFINECLDSLEKQDSFFEVIIVDNGSNDGSVDFIRENYPEYNLIENQENLGFSKAVNQGLKLVATDYVFILNNDVVLERDCINNLLKTPTFTYNSAVLCLGKRNEAGIISIS